MHIGNDVFAFYKFPFPSILLLPPPPCPLLRLPCSDTRTKPQRLWRTLTSLHRRILTSHIVLYCVKRSLHKRVGFTIHSGTQVMQSHTNSAFFKIVEALLQIHSCFFSRSTNLRGLPLIAVTVSLHYLPRWLRSTVILHVWTRTVNLALVQCESHTGKQIVIARLNQLIGIKLLTSGFLETFGS